jgi:hypothetical protein
MTDAVFRAYERLCIFPMLTRCYPMIIELVHPLARTHGNMEDTQLSPVCSIGISYNLTAWIIACTSSGWL